MLSLVISDVPNGVCFSRERASATLPGFWGIEYLYVFLESTTVRKVQREMDPGAVLSLASIDKDRLMSSGVTT